MKILVTGGLGYIGSHICDLLREREHDVEAFDLGMFTGDPNYKGRDITDVREVVDAIQGKDVVIHMAALVGDPACSKNEKLCITTNSVATAALVEAARLYNVKKFIYASTCSIYGFSEEPVTEESKPNPISLYGYSKLYSENAVKTFPNYTILRLSTVFGYSKRPRFDLVFNVLVAKAVAEGAIEIHGGAQYRPFIHVKDAARAFVFALEKDLQGTYNVGGYNYTLRQLGELISKRLKCKMNMVEKKEDPRSYNVIFDKITNAGYTMEKTVEDGIIELSEFVKKNGYKDKNWYNS